MVIFEAKISFKMLIIPWTQWIRFKYYIMTVAMLTACEGIDEMLLAPAEPTPAPTVTTVPAPTATQTPTVVVHRCRDISTH